MKQILKSIYIRTRLPLIRRLANKNGVINLYCHSVDDIVRFKEVLSQIMTYGEFVDPDESIKKMQKEGIGKRYFTISFDDGPQKKR